MKTYIRLSPRALLPIGLAGVIGFQSAFSLLAQSVQQPETNAVVSESFIFDSNLPEYNEAYQKAQTVIERDSRNGKFIAGKGWPQVWTRDSSFSAD